MLVSDINLKTINSDVEFGYVRYSLDLFTQLPFSILLSI